MVKKSEFGALPGGEVAHIYTLAAGGITVRVSDFGATLIGIEAPDAAGNMADIVLGHADLAGYAGANAAFYGATVAPVANRTAKGEVPLNGTVYQLVKNDAEVNNLHTDKEHGLHKRVWSAAISEDVEQGYQAVSFTAHMADGEFGLPGERAVTAIYSLAADGTLTLTHRMETSKRTFANITNHAYFNLAGHGSGDIRDQVVQIHAEQYVPIDAASIPTGELQDAEGTPFDFTEPHTLGERIDDDDVQLTRARGYDHCFCVGGYDEHGVLRHALHAEDPASGRAMDVRITAPGVQLYTGNWLDDPHGKDGASYGPRAGFAVEPEFYPDCVHHPDWPQPVCTPAEPFEAVIEYEFSTVA